MTLRILTALFILNSLMTTQMNAQDIHQHAIAVFNIDAQGFALDPGQMGKLTRIELRQLDLYEVISRHEVEYVLTENNIDPNHCYNKACLIDVGKKLNAGKVLTGSVEVIGENILINFRLIDVEKGIVIKTELMEFLNIPDQVTNMIAVTLQKMFNKNIDNDMLNKLTKKDDYESSINIVHTENLNLNGPRMGLIVFTGQTAEFMKMDKENGGFGLTPAMFQFGYQFEVQYLSAGNIQALFEFIPLITGLDQGQFIPSISILHGLRSNKSGFEFAFGPSFNISKINPEREAKINAAFVFGIGKTFKSGRLNFPVNAFFMPGKNGHRYGISVGFNVISYQDRQ